MNYCFTGMFSLWVVIVHVHLNLIVTDNEQMNNKKVSSLGDHGIMRLENLIIYCSSIV